MAATNGNSVPVTGEALAKAFEFGSPQGVPRDPGAGGIPYVVIPKDAQVVTLKDAIYHQHRDHPTRKQAHVRVDDAASFIEYFAMMREDDSLIFADQQKGTVMAVFDYHGKPEKQPRWLEHRATLALKKTEEWGSWAQHSGEKMGQADFAEFVEDHAPEFTKPDAATMLEIATSMRASSDANMESSMRLSNGAVKFSWNETVNGRFGSGETECPEWFTIRLAIYQGMAAKEVQCRLRYRINGGRLTLWYDILRAASIERDAFAGVIAEIRQATQQTILAGGLG